MLTACQSPHCLQPLSYLQNSSNPLYAGVDLGGKHDLTVIDVGEKIGDVMWDRIRIELLDKPVAEIKDATSGAIVPDRCSVFGAGRGSPRAYSWFVLFIDFLDEVGADGMVDVAFLGVAKYFVENGVGATMGRDDGKNPTPGGGWSFC